jgi:hypothetical protein
MDSSFFEFQVFEIKKLKLSSCDFGPFEIIFDGVMSIK